MKFLLTIFAAFLLITLAASQNYFSSFSGFNGLRAGPQRITAGSARDPRQNRGPVVFPPSPPDAIDETSGVVVGASGFGFVPPQQSTIFGKK